ncbi:acetyl-CoA acetyltransferase [alpha proteobacterium Q-1]|nr:acetyl-CoA acetyltransferase [alpha proteobacterium Q-1]
MLDPSTPILISCAQHTVRDAAPDALLSPQDLLAHAAQKALIDAGGGAGDTQRKLKITQKIDSLAVIRSFADSAPQFASPHGGCSHYPLAIARRIGASPARCFYPHLGGNSPQMMLSLLAEDIRAGRSRMALLVGGEAIRTASLATKAGQRLDWSEDHDGPLITPGDPRPGISAHELRHGLGNPSDCYPLFETALAHHYQRPMSRHRAHIADLFSRMSAVAAANPHAATPIHHRPETIMEASDDNRMIAWPYTKFMNANLFVDQAAALVLTSVHEARACGVPPDQWVFLAGAADLDDAWLMSERPSFHRSEAIPRAAHAAMDQAGIGVDDLDFIDLYSCFPVAVEIAADALGLAHDDPRGLSITGGLPYFGGAGNAYSLFAIAEMVARLRGRDRGFGLVTANGWYLTKHSMGVYSAAPPQTPWQKRDRPDLQAEIDAIAAPPLIIEPQGRGRIEAATVRFSRKGPEQGVLFGRLPSGGRFLANMAGDDQAALDALMGEDAIGLEIDVRMDEKGRGLAHLI